MKAMKIACIGTGFVGVVTSAVFATNGNQVIGLDLDKAKIKSLSAGKVPFYEPRLKELLTTSLKSGNLSFTTSYKQALKDAEIIFIMVGTPSAPDGQADLKYVFNSAASLAPYLEQNAIVVIKSTVPPGTNQKIEKIIAQKTTVKFFTASIPEFLREGCAVEDTLHPARILIGTNHEEAGIILEKLHKPFTDSIIMMKPESAQMAKYAANTYLATRITFINQIADLCEKNSADVQEVIIGIGQDPRIGQHYWYPGFGYGGSCFPKDVSELAAYSRAVGEANNLMNKVFALNQDRILKLMNRFENQLGSFKNKNIAILGLSFKPNTDDTRQAPSLSIIPYLIKKKAIVRGYDPKAIYPKTPGFTQCLSIKETAKNADVIMCLIEWPEIITFDFSTIKENQNQDFIDGRNQFNPNQVKKWGYRYLGIGRQNL